MSLCGSFGGWLGLAAEGVDTGFAVEAVAMEEDNMDMGIAAVELDAMIA